jgi:hypothetical protein
MGWGRLYGENGLIGCEFLVNDKKKIYVYSCQSLHSLITI